MKLIDLYEVQKGGLDISSHDTLDTMLKYKTELEAELSNQDNQEAKELIQRDIVDLNDMIQRKKQEKK